MAQPVNKGIHGNDCYVRRRLRGDNDTLCLDIMHDLRHLYTVILMKTESAEYGLRSGRFENFSRDHQEYVVNLRFDCGGAELQHRFAELVTWIAEQYGLWSFTVKPESVGRMSVDFEFENSTTAVAFKLVWF